MTNHTRQTNKPKNKTKLSINSLYCESNMQKCILRTKISLVFISYQEQHKKKNNEKRRIIKFNIDEKIIEKNTARKKENTPKENER